MKSSKMQGNKLFPSRERVAVPVSFRPRVSLFDQMRAMVSAEYARRLEARLDAAEAAAAEEDFSEPEDRPLTAYERAALPPIPKPVAEPAPSAPPAEAPPVGGASGAAGGAS